MEGKHQLKSTLKLGLIWYVVTLVLYGVLLYTFRKYELLSAIYHILLLFPVMLVILKRETFRNIGFRKGVADASVLFIIFVVIAVYLVRIFVFNATCYFDWGYALFASVVVASLTEEIFYRGYLQEKFCSILKYDYLAIVVVSVLFMLSHLPKLSIGMYSLPSLIFIFMIGGVLGWMYKESKSIICPIIFHALFNFIAITLYAW